MKTNFNFVWQLDKNDSKFIKIYLHPLNDPDHGNTRTPNERESVFHLIFTSAATEFYCNRNFFVSFCAHFTHSLKMLKILGMPLNSKKKIARTNKCKKKNRNLSMLCKKEKRKKWRVKNSRKKSANQRRK